MRNRRIGFHFSTILVALFAAAFVSASASATQSLRVSNNGRFLQKADGTPFFWTGDTAWRLYKLSREDVDYYMDDRAARGFNVIQGPVLLQGGTSNEWRNYYGDTNTDANNHDDGWFNHIDYIVNAAEQRGLYIALVVTWGDTMGALGGSQSDKVANASAFGQWLGARYRGNSNVIWIVAGEYNIFGTGDDIKQVWNALGNGLRSGSQGNNLITIHASFQQDRQSSSLMFNDAPWLSFNMIQSSQSGNWGPGSDNFNLVQEDYELTPVKPTIDAEANYEGLGGWDAFGVRRRAYWSVFAGGFGHTYGSIDMAVCYENGDDQSDGAGIPWYDQLDLPGANDMKFLRRLMESRPMLKRIPADNMILSWPGNVPDVIVATRDAQKRYAMIYVPSKNRTFSITTLPLSGPKIRAWWFDPRTGKATSAGQFNRSPLRTFTTPNKGQDWVLVLDDASRGYAKPGTGGPMQ